MKTALITGINGQDGSYLAELLLEKGYTVYGTIKRNSVAETQTIRLDSVYSKVILEYADMTDLSSLINVMRLSRPDEIYHLAAQSHVQISFIEPLYTTNANAVGTLNLLEAARVCCPMAKIYNAASSEMFGNSTNASGYQDEKTAMNPVSPYACSKVFAYNICKNYREAYDMYICNGILFNHESPRRGSNFVTTKIVKGANAIYRGQKKELRLGNLNSRRDWGHAKDYVRAMYMMMQCSEPDDFVIATGKSKYVSDVCQYVFNAFGMDYKDHVVIDEKYFRPRELEFLQGDPRKAKKILGWEPEYTFEKLLDELIAYWKEH
jgi:GDPmannose 4,6-dehydratase